MKTNRKTSFQSALTSAEKLENRLREMLASVRWFYENGKMEETFVWSLKLAEAAERLLLLARTLPAHTGSPRAQAAVEKIISDCIPVEIGFTAEGWFCVRIPALLPKKDTGSADYVRSFLYPALREFFRDHAPVRYTDCVLIYRHVYDQTRPERKRRDHDNIEINMVSDTIALYVLPDDGPSVCSHYYCSAQGPEDRTEVYVVPRKEFPVWLAQTMPEEGVMLSRNRADAP